MASADAVEPSDGGEHDEAWRTRVRAFVLDDTSRAFVEDRGLTFLAVTQAAASHVDLMPLASIAECGHSDCACTRSRHPWVRRRFREEVVRQAVAARDAGQLPEIISYASIGSGLLLGDFDVLLGLQVAGFIIEHACFVDSDYAENCREALSEVASFLAPARVVAYASVADYAVARLRGQQPAAHLFLQIDVVEVAFGEAASLSALALADEGGGLAFCLANRHHPTLVPMIAWRRKMTRGSIPEDAASLAAAVVRRLNEEDAGDVPSDAGACYGRLRALVDPHVSSLIEINKEPVERDCAAPP